jgi:hypothetical protein
MIWPFVIETSEEILSCNDSSFAALERFRCIFGFSGTPLQVSGSLLKRMTL